MKELSLIWLTWNKWALKWFTLKGLLQSCYIRLSQRYLRYRLDCRYDLIKCSMRDNPHNSLSNSLRGNKNINLRYSEDGCLRSTGLWNKCLQNRLNRSTRITQTSLLTTHNRCPRYNLRNSLSRLLDLSINQLSNWLRKFIKDNLQGRLRILLRKHMIPYIIYPWIRSAY